MHWTDNATRTRKGGGINLRPAHVIGGNRFATLILDGMPAPDAIDQVMSTPQLGHDAMAAWASA